MNALGVRVGLERGGVRAVSGVGGQRGTDRQVVGDAFSRIFALYGLGCARLMAGEASEAVTLLERSIELGREARTSLEQESLRVAVLSEALLSAGDVGRALQAAEESVRLARERG